MNEIWTYTICAVLVVSLLSLVGIVSLLIKQETISKILQVLVAFSAGSLLGDAFLHLIPEAFKESNVYLNVSIYIIIGMLFFFLLEKIIHWRHCHVSTFSDHPHPVGLMNIIGDAFHNFIDGMVIAASFLVSIPLGIATTLAVILHEIPQELGDFGVLLYAGYSKKKAVLFNFLSALCAVAGAILVLTIGSITQNLTIFLVPFTAGGFIYIASSDLIPELHKETKPLKSLTQLIFIIFGIILMVLLLRSG